MNDVPDARADAALLRGHGGHREAARVLVAHREVVEDVAELRSSPDLPAAEALTHDRRRARDPVHHVEVVDELLDVVIAREPGEERPAPHLPLHVAPRRLAVVVVPELHVADPQRLEMRQLADLAVADPLHQLEVLRRVALLRPDDDREPLLPGALRRVDERPHAHRIDGARLLHEEVLARVHRRRHHLRPKAGWRQQHDEVHVVEGQHLLVRVEAEEHAPGRDVDLARDLGLQLRQRRVDLVLKEVGDRNELDAGGGLQAVHGVRGASLTGPDHRHPHLVRARREDPGRRDREAQPRRRNGLVERSARNRATLVRRHDDLLNRSASAHGARRRLWTVRVRREHLRGCPITVIRSPP